MAPTKADSRFPAHASFMLDHGRAAQHWPLNQTLIPRGQNSFVFFCCLARFYSLSHDNVDQYWACLSIITFFFSLLNAWSLRISSVSASAICSSNTWAAGPSICFFFLHSFSIKFCLSNSVVDSYHPNMKAKKKNKMEKWECMLLCYQKRETRNHIKLSAFTRGVKKGEICNLTTSKPDEYDHHFSAAVWEASATTPYADFLVFYRTPACRRVWRQNTGNTHLDFNEASSTKGSHLVSVLRNVLMSVNVLLSVCVAEDGAEGQKPKYCLLDATLPNRSVMCFSSDYVNNYKRCLSNCLTSGTCKVHFQFLLQFEYLFFFITFIFLLPADVAD